MKRNDTNLEGLFHGEAGLWSAVLLDILNSIEDQKDRSGHDQCGRIIMEPESGCLPFIAAALDLDTGELQQMIIRYLKNKRIIIC